jgi:hypothetical protein
VTGQQAEAEAEAEVLAEVLEMNWHELAKKEDMLAVRKDMDNNLVVLRKDMGAMENCA